MSQPASPGHNGNGDNLSTSNSAMDSGTFYSLNDSEASYDDSDLENHNSFSTQEAFTDTDTNSSFGEHSSSQLHNAAAADQTLLANTSQLSQNLILNEQQQSSGGAGGGANLAKLTSPKSRPTESRPPAEPVQQHIAAAAGDITKKVTSSSPLPIETDSILQPKQSSKDEDVTDVGRSETETKNDSVVNISGISVQSIASNDKADENSLDLSLPAKDPEIQADGIKLYDTLEAFEANMPSTVTLLRGPNDTKVYLVGTAHFSKESQDDVSTVIRNVRPDIVMVELCSSRVHILKHDEQTLLEEAKDINISKIRSIIKTNGLINGVFYIVLLNMSAKLTKDLGMAPGGEFRRALEEVHGLEDTILHLGDRPINVTLQRALSGLSFWQTVKIVWKLIWSDEKISKEDVEQCKQKDLLEELMEQMAGEYPVFREVFVNERDIYLCHSLQVAASPIPTPPNGFRSAKVVGVVGIGHCAGIAQRWGKVDQELVAQITTVPEASRKSKAIRFAIKWVIIGSIGYGVFRLARPRLPNKLW